MSDNYCISIKPFLLDSIINWCNMNHFTPIISVKNNKKNIIPSNTTISSKNNSFLYFNLKEEYIWEKSITTNEILFKTNLKNNEPEKALLLYRENWHGVYIEEISHFIDLSFIENKDYKNNGEKLWPNGIFLNLPETVEEKLKINKENYNISNQENLKLDKKIKKPQLKLVWVNNK